MLITKYIFTCYDYGSLVIIQQNWDTCFAVGEYVWRDDYGKCIKLNRFFNSVMKYTKFISISKIWVL